jgi:large subunit ribosomal protein L28e
MGKTAGPKNAGKAGSNDLVWQLIRKSNAFTLKTKSGDRKVFSREKGNVSQAHSYKASGLANKRTVDVSAGEKGVVISIARKGMGAKVKGRAVGVTLTRGSAKAHKAASALTAGNFYRGDLEKATLARVSRVLASQKPKKAVVKKTRGRKAAVVVA